MDEEEVKLFGRRPKWNWLRSKKLWFYCGLCPNLFLCLLICILIIQLVALFELCYYCMFTNIECFKSFPESPIKFLMFIMAIIALIFNMTIIVITGLMVLGLIVYILGEVFLLIARMISSTPIQNLQNRCLNICFHPKEDV